jgi:hypothetical protein
MNHFQVPGKKYAMHGKRGACITNLIKTPGNSLHLVHRYINFMNKVINIHNIYQYIDNNDVPMYPDVPGGVYGFFMPWLKKGCLG